MLVLFETPAGFALFQVLDEGKLSKVEDIWKEFSTPESARKVVKLKSFLKFENTNEALESTSLLIEGKPSKDLRKFLRANCQNATLAVYDSKLGNSIKEKLQIECLHNNTVMELMRGVRSQLTELISGLGVEDLQPMSLGLSHSLSRYKLKFSSDKVDTMIVQAIGLLDDLDKELNTYAMRVREWYGWHFPELAKIVQDNIQYAKAVKLMGDRTNAANLDFSEVLSEEVETELKETALISMGTEVNDLDLSNIRDLCDQVLSLSDYRAQLYDYLKSRMNTIAPNLTAIVGELVGARLIAHGGSLINLAKQPGSTVQILGAEKALFRALKTKHATPKYGLIYHASLVGQAAPKFKGKISRSLAAKTALSIRYDALVEGDATIDNTLGLENRAKLEARLRILEGKELSRSAGSKKGKPMIEVYEKDRKKGTGALLTAAKSYNPSSDVILGQCTEPVQEKETKMDKKKMDRIETVPMEGVDDEEDLHKDDQKEKHEREKKKKSKSKEEVSIQDKQKERTEKKKKKKSKANEEPDEIATDVKIAEPATDVKIAEPESTGKDKKKPGAKVNEADTMGTMDPIEEPNASEVQVKKKKKIKHAEAKKQDVDRMEVPDASEVQDKKKKKIKHAEAKKQEVDPIEEPNASEVQDKKKKKRKHTEAMEREVDPVEETNASEVQDKQKKQRKHAEAKEQDIKYRENGEQSEKKEKKKSKRKE